MSIRMDGKDIPKGVRLITFGTALRWFGWGLGEAFIPVFFLLFAGNFLGVGLLASVYNVLFFLAIPFASFLADNVKAKRMIMASLIIYVFIGLGYWLAGLTSAIIFLILARALNGISYSLDIVGRETYIIRHTPKREESRVFGYFDLVANFWWILAVVIGIFLVKYIPIHWLLFFIAPTSIITLFLMMRVKEKEPPIKKKYSSILNVYKRFFREVRNFSDGLRILAVIYFTFGVISSIIYFFTPTISYLEGGTLTKSVLIILAYALPTLLGEFLGKIADKRKEETYLLGIAFIALSLASLMYFRDFPIILITVFIVSSVFELLSLTSRGVLARITERTHLGEVDGSLNAIASLGAVIGPVVFGLIADKMSVTVAYAVLIAVVLSLSILVYKGKHHLKNRPLNPKIRPIKIGIKK